MTLEAKSLKSEKTEKFDEIGQLLVFRALNYAKKSRQTGAKILANVQPEKTFKKETTKETEKSQMFSIFPDFR